MNAAMLRRLAAILALLVLWLASGASLAQNVANGEALNGAAVTKPMARQPF